MKDVTEKKYIKKIFSNRLSPKAIQMQLFKCPPELNKQVKIST